MYVIIFEEFRFLGMVFRAGVEAKNSCKPAPPQISEKEYIHSQSFQFEVGAEGYLSIIFPSGTVTAPEHGEQRFRVIRVALDTAADWKRLPVSSRDDHDRSCLRHRLRSWCYCDNSLSEVDLPHLFDTLPFYVLRIHNLPHPIRFVWESVPSWAGYYKLPR